MIIDLISKHQPLVLIALYDVLRLLAMQLIAQFSFSMFHSNIKFLNPVFIQTTLFLIIGLLVFWFLVYKNFPIKKIVSSIINGKDIKDRKPE
jgi:ABC-type sulfate transport system permease component